MRRKLSTVAVLALALLAAPAAFADAPPEAAAPAAPAAGTHRATGEVAAGTPALCPTTDRLGNPAAPTFVSSGPCYVERQCDDGSTIYCNGSSSCSSGPGDGGGYVTCDGVTTWCPIDNCPDDGDFCKYDGTSCGTCLDGAPCTCYSSRCTCL